MTLVSCLKVKLETVDIVVDVSHLGLLSRRDMLGEMSSVTSDLQETIMKRYNFAHLKA